MYRVIPTVCSSLGGPRIGSTVSAARRLGCSCEVRDLNQPAPYVHWGFILISLPNLGVIIFMIILFVAALFLPFPGRARRRRSYQDQKREP